jgi:hypothetical protein
MAAEHQMVAAVLSPRTLPPSLKMTPHRGSRLQRSRRRRCVPGQKGRYRANALIETFCGRINRPEDTHWTIGFAPVRYRFAQVHDLRVELPMSAEFLKTNFDDGALNEKIKAAEG